MSIGVFDSGVGGLTIWRELVRCMPTESTIYLADSKNAPYGERSTQEVIELSIRNTQYLIARGASMIVVACNTATTQAIDVLRSEFEIPFIGIEPAVKPAALNSVSKYIGVLATNGTIDSDHFNRTKEQFSDNVRVITQVGEGLVTAIENGLIDSPQMKEILKAHLDRLTAFPIDALVLGCTHYPLLIPLIKDLIPSEIDIVDSGIAVAQQAEKVLKTNNLECAQSALVMHHMVSTGDLSVLKSICKNHLSISGLKMDYSLYHSE